MITKIDLPNGYQIELTVIRMAGVAYADVFGRNELGRKVCKHSTRQMHARDAKLVEKMAREWVAAQAEGA